MSALQWALLLFAVAAVVGIYWFSRRQPTELDRKQPDTSGGDQMDLWRIPEGASAGKFDEHGVSEPRVRGRAAPSLDLSQPNEEPEAQAEPKLQRAEHKDDPAPRKAAEEKIISFYIAEREGTYILGPQIHRALAEQGLKFGERKIYYRLHEGKTVFAVASLLKPGELDPEQAAGFSTPGLSVFMVLPCAQRAEAAYADMLGTARALATALHAQLHDGNRQPLSEAAAETLREEVAAWARRNESGA